MSDTQYSLFVFTKRAHLTLMQELESYSLDLIYMLEQDWFACGHLLRLAYLPCKRETTLPVLSTLELILLELVFLFGKCKVEFQSCSKFGKRRHGPKSTWQKLQLRQQDKS